MVKKCFGSTYKNVKYKEFFAQGYSQNCQGSAQRQKDTFQSEILKLGSNNNLKVKSVSNFFLSQKSLKNKFLDKLSDFANAFFK